LNCPRDDVTKKASRIDIERDADGVGVVGLSKTVV
jgi:hypothetical protein